MCSYVSFIFQCPQCHQQIDDQNKSRIVTETCGHSKCRNCFIKEESGCVKCQSSQTHLEFMKEESKVNDDAEVNVNEIVFKGETNSKNIRVIEEVIIKPSVDIPNKSDVSILPRIRETRKFNYPSHLSCNVINGITEFECKICDKTFRSKDNRKYHLYCDKSVEKPFNCVRCAKRFATKNHLKYHENRHNNIQHICKECHRIFASSISLQTHLKIHSGDYQYICDECDKKYFSKSDLILHMHKHYKMPLPFHCHTCNKSFSAKFKLNQHLLIHKGANERNHSCKLCGKAFSRNSTLTLHMLTHSNLQTKFECGLCSKSFERQHSYDRHMKIKHGSTLFRCPLCSVTSGRKDNILRHIRNLHSEENFNEIAKKISIKTMHHNKIKLPKESSGEVVNLNIDQPHTAKECDVTPTPTEETKPSIVNINPTVCQYQSVIKFAGRVQEAQSSVNEINANGAENSSTPVTAYSSSSSTENVPKKFDNELRIELTEPTEQDPKISNHSIYLQLLSPYLKPPPNLDLRNGISEQTGHRGFRKIQSDRLQLRKDNVDICRSILLSTDEESQMTIQKSSVLHDNSKLPNNKTESFVIHTESKEYFWRKRTSQCFSQMEIEH